MGLKQWREVLELADRLIAIPAEEVAGQTLAAIAHHELKHYEQRSTPPAGSSCSTRSLKRMPLPRRCSGTTWPRPDGPGPDRGGAAIPRAGAGRFAKMPA